MADLYVALRLSSKPIVRTPMELAMSAATPAPGSDDAVALGCTCPVIDNARGRGYLPASGDRPAQYVYRLGCEVHRLAADEALAGMGWDEP